MHIKHAKWMCLESNLECMVIYVFVNIKSVKCIKSVHERKSKWYKFSSKYQKKDVLLKQ